MLKKILLCLFVQCISAFEISPINSAADERIKEVQYVKDVPIKYVGVYGVESMITFDSDEKIEKIIISDSAAWSTKLLYDNKLLIKPIEENPETNMIIMTNKNRTYHFILHANKIDSISNPDVVLEMKIIFHNENDIMKTVPDVSKDDPSFNKQYAFKRKHSVFNNVYYIFDDGKKTYIRIHSSSEAPIVMVRKHPKDKFLVTPWAFSDDKKHIIIDGVFDAVKLTMSKKNMVLNNYAGKGIKR